MSRDVLLPHVKDDARVEVFVEIESIHERFEAGTISRSLIPCKPGLLEWGSGFQGTERIDESEVERSILGVAEVRSKTPFGPWPKGQRIVIEIRVIYQLHVDFYGYPMMGWVKTEELPDGSVVVVILELLPAVAARLFANIDAAIVRPQTTVGLDMVWRFTERYKSQDGYGSGSAMWYPIEVTVRRGSVVNRR
jgi:hypothetical protein